MDDTLAAAANAIANAQLQELPLLLTALANQITPRELEDDGNFWDVEAPRVGQMQPPTTIDPWSTLYCLAAVAPLPILMLVEQELKKMDVELVGLVDQNGNSPLNLAILAGQVENVRHLSTAFPSLCLRHNWNKKVPLDFAVRAGSPEILELILAGAHAKAGTRLDDQGNTVLMSAVSQGQVELVEFLLSTPSGKDALSKCNHDGESPLMLAAQGGSLPLVQLLLAGGADVAAHDDSANTAIHYAVRANQLEVLRTLVVQERANLDVTNDDDETALHLAPLVSQTAEILICLLDAKADLAITDSEGCTVLHRAIRAHNLECVKQLSDRCHLESRTEEGLTSLLTAAKYSNVQIICQLIDAKADCTAVDNRGQTVLHLALISPGTMALELIQTGRFSLEARDVDDMTPFLVASRYADLETVEYLAEDALVNIDARDKEGDSALAMAVVGNRLDLLPYLLSIGSSQVRNLKGQTPLMLAARYSMPEVLQCLIEAEADMAVRDAQGLDCVMSAVLGGNLPCLRVLIHHHCGITAVNNEGESALFLGLRTNDETIIDFLMHIPQRPADVLHILPKSVVDAVLVRDRAIKRCPPGKRGDMLRRQIFETKEELLETWQLPDVVVAKVCCWDNRRQDRRARKERISARGNEQE